MQASFQTHKRACKALNLSVEIASYSDEIRMKKGYIYMIPYGSLINAIAVIIGGLIGLTLGSRLSKDMQALMYQGLGLCVLSIGIKMAITSEAPILVIFSIIAGSGVGVLCKLEERFMRVGDALRVRIHSKNPLFVDGFVNASVLFCVGAMSIVGSFDEGLRGDRTILLTKSMLDACAAMAMASTMGVGVLFAAVTVLVYQGLLTLFAATFSVWFWEALMLELVATGGILIMGIGFNLLGVTQISLSNMIPSLLIIVMLGQFFL